MRRLLVIVTLLIASSLHAQFEEKITVSRVIVDVRVTTADGEPIVDLVPDHFRVRVGNKIAIVETAEWIDDSSPAVDLPDTAQMPPLITRPSRRGRILVLFIQTDFGRHDARLKGQMNFNLHLEELVESLPADDRIAVFSFDSHLKFRSDLTTDREAVIAAIRASLRIDEPSPPPAVPVPSLARHLDREAMRRVTSSEAALRLVAQALAHIDGPKSLLLVGWGLGERAGGAVSMKRQWTPARQALDAARVSIFALDTTYADRHDLETGLKIAAEQTGGFYAKTNMLAQGAVERLRRTLSGHYELELRTDAPLRPGTHAISIRTNRRGAIVLAPSSVIIRP